MGPAQRFKKTRNFVFFTATILLSNLALSQSKDRAKALPMEAADVVESDLANAEAAVLRMYGTEDYTSPNPDRWVTGTKSTTIVEKSALKQWIDSEAGPGDHIYLGRYGLTDREAVQLLIAAKKKGIKVSVAVDFNRALVAPAGTGPKGSTDFANMKAQSRSGGASEDPEDVNPMFKAIQELLAAGFQYNQGDWSIVSQPVFPREGDEMISILHDKALFFVKREGKADESVRMFHGTANFSDITRINSLMEVVDPHLNKYYLNIMRDMIETFAKGGSIQDIPTRKPLRVKYKDGSFIEAAHTFGKYNLNDRITDLFRRGLQDPENFKVESVVFNQFLITYRPTVEALIELMKANPALRASGILDDSFIEQDSQGLGGVLDGQDVFRKYGGAVSGEGYDINSRVDFWIHQAPAVNLVTGETLVETSRAQAHAQKKLQHNKTTVVFVNEGGKRWAYVFFGSFNLSGHFENSEFQMMMKVPAESFIAQHAQWDVDNIVKTNPAHFLKTEKAVVRNMIAAYTEQSDLVVPMQAISRAERAILRRNYADLFKVLREVYAQPSTIEKRISPADFETRLQKLEAYFKWYETSLPKSELSDFYRLKKFVSLIFVSTRLDSMDDWVLERAIRGALWRPNIDEKLLDDAVVETWHRLGFPGEPYFLKRRAADLKLAAELPATAVGMAYIQDWDDNIITMSRVYLFDRVTGEETWVWTDKWAEIRHDVKNGTGEWGTKYKIDRDPVRGSFRRFENKLGKNYALEDLIAVLDSPDFEKRLGKSWKNMIEALSTEYSAEQFYILTARSNPPEDLYECLKELKRRKIIRFLPPKANIYTGQNPANPEQAKADKIVQHLNRQAKSVVPHVAPKVLDRDAKETNGVHLMGFSDDDWGNFEAVLKAVSDGVRRGYWKNIKIVLKYTGQDPRGAEMGSIVIKSDGSWRPSIPNENLEFRTHFNVECEVPLLDTKPAA